MVRMAAAAAIAAVLALAYGTQFAPRWDEHYDDHLEYVGLALGLAERGEYTRAPVGDAFVPEPLRLPGYPLFLAAVCKTAGCNGWSVAAIQAGLLALMIPLTQWVVRRIDPLAATPTAWATALYLPLASYAARPVSDFLAAFLLLLGTAVFFIARDRRSVAWGAVFGAACAWSALTRPVFLLIPFAFAIGGGLMDRAVLARAWRAWLFAGIAFIALISPVTVYEWAYFGSPFPGSSGTLLWLGYFQGRGASPEDVERYDRAALGTASLSEVVALGSRVGLDPFEAITSAEVKRRVAGFDGLADRTAQGYAWVELDPYLRARALDLIREHPWDWAVRGLTTRSVELWAGEAPFSSPGGESAPLPVQIAAISIQLVLLALAVLGMIAGIRAGRRETYLIAVLLAYVWVASFPFMTEARYSLAVKPFLLTSAVIGGRAMVASLKRVA